ncbi:MAG: right-handed parallel beta-helix repeat-containing protein [Gammaproteobacteria bacterium]
MSCGVLAIYAVCTAGVFFACTCVITRAEVYEISPSIAGADCVEEFEQVANRLKPGDRLVLKGGRYEQACRRAVSVQGTKERPIVIEAEAGERPVLARPHNNRNSENNIELVDVRYLTIRGVEFSGGSIGVRLLGDTDHFELAHSIIRDTANNAFAANVGNSRHLNLHHNTVHKTGQSEAPTEGEGFYLGCHDQSCSVSNSRVEHNNLFDLQGAGGGGNDGIEIKPGSGGNVVRHNSITGSGNKSDYPCILVYGGGAQNVVENNLLKNCSVGIYAASDALIRGNVVLESAVAGIEIHSHETVGAPSGVTLANNTIVNRMSGGSGMHLSLWRARHVAVLNNAVLTTRGPAIKGFWLGSAEFSSNWAGGQLRGVPLARKGIKRNKLNGSIPLPSDVEYFYLEQFEDAGTSDTSIADSSDRAGVRRPQGSAIDIGAYERPVRK